MNFKEIECTFPPNAKAYKNDVGLLVLVNADNTPKWGKLKHISISRTNMYPSWDEILRVKDYFFGDVDCMMVMPKEQDYINCHQFCFHIWQTPQEWGLK